MSTVICEQQQREQELLSSFMEMVQAEDGDFTVIAKISHASSDQHSLQLIVQQLSQHPQVREAFKSRFSLGEIDLEQLSKLSEGSLGRQYAEHMLHNQLKPLQAPPAESDHDFLGTHLAETHDIWHVMTGSKTDILGEVTLQAFCAAQLDYSRFWLALLTKNLLKSTIYSIESSTQYMDSLTKGWLMGKKAKPLFGIDWNTQWETPIEQLRNNLDIEI